MSKEQISSENQTPKLTGKALRENQLLRILNAKQKAMKKLRFIRMLEKDRINQNK